MSDIDDDSISIKHVNPSQDEKPSDDIQQASEGTTKPETILKEVDTTMPPKSNKGTKIFKHKSNSRAKSKTKSAKKRVTAKDSGLDDSDDDEDRSISSGSSDDTSSDEDDIKARKKLKAQKKKKKQKSKSKSRRRKEVCDTSSDSDDSDIEDSDTSSEEDIKKRRKTKKKNKRRWIDSDDENSPNEEDDLEEIARLQATLAEVNLRRHNRARGLTTRLLDRSAGHGKTRDKPGKRASKLEFKRVDELWDRTTHNYKLTESAKEVPDVFSQYVFNVRRKFDWESKHKATVVDIKSKLLRNALQDVLKDVKGVSLVEDTPSVSPNMLFLYLEELRIYAKQTLKAKVKAEKKPKLRKNLGDIVKHCKVLIRYLDEDYEETKKTLFPMLEEGTITFDLLWALFKPNTLAFTTTYGSVDDPRCFKVESATKESSFMRGDWLCVQGRYLEYDGKSFGFGEIDIDVDAFKGARKITSLVTYPLQYHKDPEGVKTQLIERGKHFISLQGMNYRFHKGMAFMKKKRAVAKVNINGRIMVDPALFRRVNPNYQISLVKSKDPDGNDEEEEDDCGCGDDSDEEEGGPQDYSADKDEKEPALKKKWRAILGEDGHYHAIQVEVDENGLEIHTEKIEARADVTNATTGKREFSEEELLVASPVVFGFAFSEKLWLEFSLSGVRDIEWNEGAFESLVLPANQKSIVKALVESHKFHAAKTIDDVVQGKGKGLVAVLHGPPGTGKTLTAEGIAELLRCPLYMVSAGELGTDARMLEHELQRILDIAHSWGAVLLLDEADVFLEMRQLHDIQRNALVSIFLRLLEYFQGILFLTTNRVQTFDDAFQSRIHIALRYGELNSKAKKAVWKMFLEKVNAMEGAETVHWTEAEYETLSRFQLNGRQIKNSVRTAQALAVNENTKLSMEHLKRVLHVAESFEQDFKGGTGYSDAMRSYQ